MISSLLPPSLLLIHNWAISQKEGCYFRVLLEIKTENKSLEIVKLPICVLRLCSDSPLSEI